MSYIMDVPSTLKIFVLLLITKGLHATNSPPSLGCCRDWLIMEEDNVNDIVASLTANDAERDNVTFSLESQQPSGDLHTYFKIDKNDRVRIAKPLTGLAKGGYATYLLKVRMDDGTTTSVTEVLLKITKDGRAGGSRWGGFGPGRPPPPPIPFNPPFPANGRPPIPVNGRPPIPVNGRPPFPVNGGSINNFNPPQPNIHRNAPPLIKLNSREWKVNADTAIGTIVDEIGVIDIPGLGYNLTLEGAKGLLQVDSHGIVRVAASLTNQDEVLIIDVIASNAYSKSSEQVSLRVLPPSTSPPTTPTTSPLPPPPTLPSSSTPKAKVGDKGNNSQDLRVVVGGSGGSPANSGSSRTPTETPKEAPETDYSLTIIPIVVVAGISPVALAIYCYWRRIQRRKDRAAAKESAVVYTEKGEEATATQLTQVTPRRTSTQNNQTRSNSRIGFAAFFHRRAQSNKYENDLKARNANNKRKLSEISAPIRDVWEYPRHHLKFMGILGEGCFGQVWKCEALELREKGPMLVAVKTLKESAGERERRDLVQELKVLKNLGNHINVVSLLGCCTEKDPIFIILEYMTGGKLQSYLRASRADANYGNLHGSSSSLTPRDLTIFTYQIARGMEFLARNGIIHRDLAARNVLVGEDKICKVADFGFARDVANNRIYERKSDGRLPIRWMAPESLFDNIFTTKSDVWSFGVLLWEIVTLGSTPYPGLGASEVMKKVKDGYRLEKPDHCRREIYNIMYYCWDKDSKERPSFTELVHTLESLLLSEVDYIELDRFPDHSYYNIIAEKNDELL